jgi:RNA polymerase sigma-70 factor (ECF subfamily)
LLAAVEQLPKRQRSIVILSQFEEYSTKDVSNMLNIAESTVRVHLFRAIRSLRTLIRNVQPSSKDNAAV